ncbi:MAG: hypothetical protein FWE90_06650 [Defluviitaleaceae bacterium]|nr:hypothetical protein [Defluviitaleaceae bacterium]
MRTYVTRPHTEPDMAVTRFKWQTDFENNVLLSWTWPKNADVKYMLAAATTENPDDPLEYLMQNPARHTVITRNLAAHYAVPIGPEPKRYILAPAYLQDKEITVYGPALTTDLLHAKAHAHLRITNRPIPFGPYKRVSFTITFDDGHAAAIGKDALRYHLYEYSRLIGTYPLDEGIMAGGYMYIKKTQHIRFFINDEYAHLIALV